MTAFLIKGILNPSKEKSTIITNHMKNNPSNEKQPLLSISECYMATEMITNAL